MPWYVYVAIACQLILYTYIVFRIGYSTGLWSGVAMTINGMKIERKRKHNGKARR